MSGLRVIDWNVQGRRDVAKQMTFLDELGWDILLLQEVRQATSPGSWPTPVSAPVTRRSSTFRTESMPTSSGAQRSFCARACRLIGSRPLDDVPSPERALWASVELGGPLIDVASLAAPPASSGWKELKAVQVDRYHEEWARRSRPLVVAIDRNTPKIDHPDLERCEYFWKAEETLRPHGVHLEQPDELELVRAKGPNGPSPRPSSAADVAGEAPMRATTRSTPLRGWR